MPGVVPDSFDAAGQDAADLDDESVRAVHGPIPCRKVCGAHVDAWSVTLLQFPPS
jgi:hypothetical protein